MNQQYQQINFVVGTDIENAVNTLLNCKESGILAYGEFNGVTLYSDTVTMDGAYKEITGKTKSEYEEAQHQWMEEYKRKDQDHKDNIPSLIELWESKGKEVLNEDKLEYWNRIVPIRLNDLYHGMELGCCLDIVKILNNNGSMEEAKEEIEKQGHSGMSFGLVCSMVKEFSDRGAEFVKYVS